MLQARLLIATFWAGSLWTVGYLVAPTLFAMLADKALAGSVAGQLFRIEAWLSIACGIGLIALLLLAKEARAPKHGKILLAIVCAMLICTLISHFGLQPLMAELRQAAGGQAIMESGARTKFGILHGLSAALYLIQSLLAVALVLKIR